MNQSIDEHESVMVTEVINGLNINPAGIYIDATFGRGGHSRAILEKLNNKGRLLAMDRDIAAVPYANALAKNDARFTFIKSPFSKIIELSESQKVMENVDGILMDLGVSSPQLNTPERGFSFRLMGPLDMRMDQKANHSAADWINAAKEEEIDFVLKTYGEERFHRRIAKAIVNARLEGKISTTQQLSEIISKAHPAWEKHKHPATRSFQAIRIFINNELGELREALEGSLKALKNHGRLVVISFHSLEDRIVKQFIQSHEQGESYPRGLPILNKDIHKSLIHVGRKQKPTQEEVSRNVRARSAVLRVAEKIKASEKEVKE